MPVDVTPANFEQVVLQGSRSRPVVVDFWAPWCQPCLQLAPTLEQLEAESAGRWTLAKANVQDHPELGQAFGISGIPALKAFKDGLVHLELVGLVSRAQLETWLATFVPGEELDRLEAARDAEGRGDDEAAESAYRQALETKPGFDAAVVGLAALLERTGRIEEAGELVEGIEGATAARIRIEQEAATVPPLGQARRDAESGGTAERYRLAVAEAAAGEHAAALERLLAIVREDRTFGDDAARRLMLQVFEVLGAESELADDYRRRLSMLLF